MITPNSEIFENNLHLLSHKNKQLAAALRIIPMPSSIRIFQSTSGLFTAEIQITPDCSKLLHSSFDPRQEAGAWAQQQNMVTDVFVLLGLGLGYPALSLLDHGFSGKLIIVEKDMEIFKLAFLHCDLTSILCNEKVFLFVGQEADGLLSFLKKTVIGRLGYKIYSPAAALHRQFYEEMGWELDKIIHEQRRISDPQLTDGIEMLLQAMKD